jgi:hypothetical protein
MAYDFDGTNQDIRSTSVPVGVNEPITFSAWFNTDSDTVEQTIVAACNNTNTTGAFYTLTFAAAATGDPIRSGKYIGSGSTIVAAANTTGFVGNWKHVCAVFSSDTLRAVWQNGTETTNTTSLGDTSQTFNRFSIGCLPRSTGVAYTNGRIAEVGVWSIALTGAEIAGLSKGIKPPRIRPQNIVLYAPLIRNIQDTRGGITFTNENSATVANHPRVY